MDFGMLLKFFVVVLVPIVLLGYLNEKTLKLPTEIALMLGSALIGLLLFAGKGLIPSVDPLSEVSTIRTAFSLNNYLMDGVLCFMLFSGATGLTLEKMKPDMKLIGALSIVTTLLTTFIFGGLFYLVSELCGVGLRFIYCLLLGSIVAATDPIAAMSILKKTGLAERTGVVIEGESLFNDGVGVALYISISGIASGEGATLSSFLTVFARELLGAAAVGLVVSFLLFQLFRRTGDPSRRVFASLLAVSLSYVICEACDFSGAIASVVCGIYFATQIGKRATKQSAQFNETYNSFWGVVDSLLNGALYVLLGLSFMTLNPLPALTGILAGAIVANLLSRFLGVGLTVLMVRPPDLSRPRFTCLLAWSGLKGGLCLALAMSSASYLPADVYDFIIASTYAIVFFTTAIQGLTVGRVYRGLAKA